MSVRLQASGDRPDGRSPRPRGFRSFLRRLASLSLACKRRLIFGLQASGDRPICRSPQSRRTRGPLRGRTTSARFTQAKQFFVGGPAGTSRMAGPRVSRSPKPSAQVRNLVSHLATAKQELLFLTAGRRGLAALPVPESSRNPRNRVSPLTVAKHNKFVLHASQRGPAGLAVPAS